MAHHRKVFVVKDLNYGSSKSSTTLNTALNPADLADGAIGVFGIHTTGSTNLNKLVLITDGGSEAAGSVPAASFVGTELYIAMGTPNGVLVSNPIQIAQIHTFLGSKYVAPVKGVSVIGYTSGGGLLNYPATILKGDEISVSASNRRDTISGEASPYVTERYSVQLAAGQSAYSALSKFVLRMSLMDTTQERTLVDVPVIVHNGTGAVFANAATVAAVNGATTLTTSAAHGVTAGDAISLGGDYYLTITGTTGSTLVLDRPYQGATATIANANTLDITGAATIWGLQFTDSNFFANIELATQGVLESSTITRTVLPLQGSGSYEHALRTEKEFRAMLGTSDEITSYIPKEPFKAVAGTTYDFYSCEIRNAKFARGDAGSVFKILNYVLLFFPVVADTAGKNQSDFEDIMQTSTLFGTTFPSLTA